MGMQANTNVLRAAGFWLLATVVLWGGILWATGAFSQDASPTPTPVEMASPAPAPAPVQRYYLELDQNDLQAVSNALAELPKRIADPLILKLNAQLQAQAQIIANKAKADEAKPKPKK